MGGTFSTLAGKSCFNLARLNPDGTLDSTFQGWTSDWVGTVALQPDGKILVGGTFTLLNAQPRDYLGRLDAEGALDSGFNPGAGRSDDESPIVSSLLVQANGKILVGGYFTTLGGQPRTNLARLNGDGTLDSSFNPGANASVSSLAMQAARSWWEAISPPWADSLAPI